MRSFIAITGTVFLFLAGTTVRSQIRHRVDSLNEVIARSKPDTNRVNTLLELEFEYQYAHPDSTLMYANEALQLSKKIGYVKGESRSWRSQAFCENERNNLVLAIQYGQNALEAGIRGKLTQETASAYELLGFVNASLGYLQEAIGYFKEAEKGYKKINNQEALSVCYVNMGYMYSNAAFLSSNEKDSLYQLALNYELKGLAIRREIRRTTNPKLTIVTTLTNIADDYEALNQDSTALAIIAEAEVYAKENGNLRGLFNQKVLKAEIAFKRGNLAESETLATEAITDEKIIYGKPDNEDLYLLLSNIYVQKKDYQKAYEYRLIQQQLMNSRLYNAEALKASQALRKKLEDEKVANEKHIQQLYLFMIGGGLVVVLFILGLVYRNNIRQKRNYRKLAIQSRQIQSTLESLRATQAQLVQSEKMASLGDLTAGIAHEIQNPLNFVNNFSDVNKELLSEMNTEIEKGNYDEAKAIAKDVTNNEEKINHHGKRADAIVKGMLQHSRTSNGQKEATDINALCDEYLRLAYHGLRAKDKSFNATTKTDFDNSIGKINIVSQDIGRVILNLINNAFYAVDEKKKQIGDSYEPTVSVNTKKINGKVEISVKDNGNGIPKKVLDKIFQPFFTTKPTGQGTGLGLSLSYDIVKAHGGELKVETKEGEGSEFIITL